MSEEPLHMYLLHLNTRRYTSTLAYVYIYIPQSAYIQGRSQKKSGGLYVGVALNLVLVSYILQFRILTVKNVGIATDTIMLLAHNKQLLLVYA